MIVPEDRLRGWLTEGDAGSSLAGVDAYAEVAVEFTVNTWLATEEANPFQPAPNAPDGAPAGASQDWAVRQRPSVHC